MRYAPHTTRRAPPIATPPSPNARARGSTVTNRIFSFERASLHAPAHRARRASRRRNRHRPHRHRRRRRVRLRTARTCPRRGTSTRAARCGVPRARAPCGRPMRASSIDDSRAFSTRAFAGAIAAGERVMDGDRGRSIVGASAIGGDRRRRRRRRRVGRRCGPGTRIVICQGVVIGDGRGTYGM